MRDEVLASWTFEPWLAISLLILAATYLRGSIRRLPEAPRRLALRPGCTPARVAGYLGGLLAIWLALASPIEAFAPLLLSAHMVQHMLLTIVAAPLLLMGEPLLPLVRGLPAAIRRDWVGPFMASAALRRVGRWVVHPIVAWSTFNLLLVIWHLPGPYELALREPAWHRAEHLSLLGAAILLWWPVVQPAPSRAWWPRWTMVPYLLLADMVNTAIAASFAFAPRVLYASYAATAPALGIDALRDQAAAGAIMWVPGSVAFLVPAALILVRLMRPRAWIIAAEAARPRGPWNPPRRQRRPFDLLRVPLLGPALARRRIRVALRAIMLLLAAVIVLDGFLGPREAPMNLAGTLPWTHWRGAAVLLLLIGGNFLCMTCPFVLPRMAAERWRRWRRDRSSSAPRQGGVVLGALLGALPAAPATCAAGAGARGASKAGPARPAPPARSWPRLLRNKWTAVALVAGWLVVYEAFDLWASPLATAWLIVAYFSAAFLVDSLASSGAFCKWVCPLGQFHFAQSTLSPLTVAAREPAVCAACTTHDCLRGNQSQRGCGLDLFIPRKIGNLDCTFCLDCADACPHDNVGVLAQRAGAELRSDSWRSSLGRLSGRTDVAALLLVLSVGAVVNAAGMTGPVLDLMAQAAEALAWPRSLAAVLVVSLMIALAAGAVAGAAWVMSLFADAEPPRRGAVNLLDARLREPARPRPWRRAFAALAFSLAPLGAAVWLVHFSFHFVTSWKTAGPVIVRAASDLGVTGARPEWSSACCSHPPEWLLPANLLALSIGTALSLWTLARRVAPARDGANRRSGRGIATWLVGALVIVLVWAGAAWVLFQPMDMRGTLGFEVIP